MKKLIVLSCVVSSVAMSGCCFLGIGPKSSSKAAAPAAAGAGAAAASSSSDDSSGVPVWVPGKTTTIDLDIKFATGKDEVLPLYDHQLKRVAMFMEKYPETTADIEGYADTVGERDDNKALSQRRADAVRNTLIARFDVEPARMTTKGYGERPYIGVGSVAERARNRRVTASFNGQ